MLAELEANLVSAMDWPTPDMGDVVRLPCDTYPSVFVRGDWDTSTPVENPPGLLPYFSTSRDPRPSRHDGPFYQLREAHRPTGHL